MAKKNCNNCIYLEWIEAEFWDDSGYCCNKRINLTEKKEDELLFNLTKEAYREKSKICFEAK